MLILTIRTDNPNAELGLYDDEHRLDYHEWLADRQLAETINTRIKELLDRNNHELTHVKAVIIFKGPGSFTGLRIGISVANALAFSLKVPIVSAMDDNWIIEGRDRLSRGEDEKSTIPEYGSLPHITQPRK